MKKALLTVSLALAGASLLAPAVTRAEARRAAASESLTDDCCDWRLRHRPDRWERLQLRQEKRWRDAERRLQERLERRSRDRERRLQDRLDRLERKHLRTMERLREKQWRRQERLDRKRWERWDRWDHDGWRFRRDRWSFRDNL